MEGKKLSPREEEIIAQGANWEHDEGKSFTMTIFSPRIRGQSILTFLLLPGAIHSSDLEKMFQIRNWLEDPFLKGKKKQEVYGIIASRFIESAPSENTAKDLSKAMTAFNVEKYMYVVDSFKDCPLAWSKLEQMYDLYGEESKVKMNSLYPSEFRKLNDQCKCMILDGIEKNEIKSAGKVFYFYFSVHFSLQLRSRMLH